MIIATCTALAIANQIMGNVAGRDIQLADEIISRSNYDANGCRVLFIDMDIHGCKDGRG